jgi:hypothetical protein
LLKEFMLKETLKNGSSNFKMKCRDLFKEFAQEELRIASHTLPCMTSFPHIHQLLPCWVSRCVGPRRLRIASRRVKKKSLQSSKGKKDIFGVMSELSLMCLMEMNKLVRQKTETLVTIHVHQRDLFIDLEKDCQQHKIKDKNDFEWQKNTRVYWRTDTGHVAICVTDVEFTYSYEFLGAKERLCITPLTDRCYITLS